MKKNKTKLKTVSFITWGDVCSDFQNKYGYDVLHDALNSSGHFYEWCKKRGYKKDKKGKAPGDSQIFYKEYNESEDGNRCCPRSHNLWHFLNEEYIVDPGHYLLYIYKDTHKCREKWAAKLLKEIWEQYQGLFKDGVVNINIYND
jgi:hypothetical protein